MSRPIPKPRTWPDESQRLVDRRLWAGLMVAADLDACEGLLRGLAVPRHRLHGGVLVAIDEPVEGPPISLSDELALRVELALHEGWWAAGRPTPGSRAA